MGLAAVAAAIVLSACAGVATRRRLGAPAEHDAARLLKAMLFGAMPFVTFFNVAHVELTVTSSAASWSDGSRWPRSPCSPGA